eukprot:scaffold12830_cov33-Phaeocystis_antarctica.AAC.4
MAGLAVLRCLPHHTPTRVGCPTLNTPYLCSRVRCPDVCITPTRVGCPARLLRPAYDGRARCSDACRITHLLA